MALIIEDGTNVSTANSFVTVDEIRAYAEARGRSLPEDDTELEQLSFRAIDYIISRRNEYQGVITYPANPDALPPVVQQPLPFPRTGMIIDGVTIPSNVIPIDVKNLQNSLIIEGATGTEYWTTTESGQAVKFKKTGPLEKEFFGPSSTGVNGYTSMPGIDAIIGPLLKYYGGFPLRVRRI